jgi:helix-turn-helix protein
MATIIRLRDHARASSATGLKKASIGTVPPDTSLSRLASPRDASLRPAQMFRRWASEQSAASATCETDISLALAQRSIGCSDIAYISPRNEKSQQQIFPAEIIYPNNDLLKWVMNKPDEDDAPNIYLGAWLDLFDLPIGEAAKIAGCGQSYISNIIANRKSNINVLYLLRLSDELGVTINDFYRPLPSKSQLNALKSLSPKAQATLLARQQRKA